MKHQKTNDQNKFAFITIIALALSFFLFSFPVFAEETGSSSEANSLTTQQEEELQEADEQIAQIAAEQGTTAPEIIVKAGDIGVDISAWQGTLSQADWKKIKNAGVTFTILRVGWGHAGNGAKDSQFDNNYAKAKAAGLSVGAYLYSYADDTKEAQAEADYAKSLLGGKTLDLPLAFDYEEQKIVDKYNGSHHAAVIQAFCERVRSYGYEPMLYANLSTLNKIPYDQIKQYRIWIAQYSSSNNYNHPYDIWQYSDSGKVKGINDKLDMNKAAKDFQK